jgi:hypothetical protein
VHGTIPWRYNGRNPSSAYLQAFGEMLMGCIQLRSLLALLIIQLLSVSYSRTYFFPVNAFI